MNLFSRRREERKAVDEAGGGVSEGFELAESDLIEHASHSDAGGTSAIFEDAASEELEMPDSIYGEADDSHLRDGR